MRVGYIGLGVMGGALATRLAQSRPLQVFDRSEQAVERLVREGATAAGSLADLSAACDVVMLCLPRSENVREVIFGPDGLAEHLRAGSIIIDQTSGDPEQTRDMARQLAPSGIDIVDAPVSGGAKGAEQGTISIMLGGEAAACDRVRPVLQQISPNIFDCGAVGSGQVMKLINNMISTCNRFAMLEGVALGLRNGLDLSVMTESLNSGGARSKASETMLPALVKGVPNSFFAMSLMLKDLDLAMELGTASNAPLPFGHLARDMLAEASAERGPEANLFDISDYVAARAGVHFPSASSDEKD